MLTNKVRRGITRSLTSKRGMAVFGANFFDPSPPQHDGHDRRRLRCLPPAARNCSVETISFPASIQQKRSMVMVTKTKVAELPSDDVDDNHTTTSSTDATTYVTQSESLLVTPTCLQRVEKLIRQRQEKENSTSQGFFLRVFVDAGGCSGFQYQFEIDHELDEEDGDIVIVSASADDTLHPRIVIDETSLGFLEGATLDYVVEMIKSAFVVRDNPKSESACGCGSSFAMKNFTANPAMD